MGKETSGEWWSMRTTYWYAVRRLLQGKNRVRFPQDSHVSPIGMSDGIKDRDLSNVRSIDRSTLIRKKRNTVDFVGDRSERQKKESISAAFY